MTLSLTRGIVSNCWKTQLDQGAALADLIERAEQIGYRAVELRQTALGEFETGEDSLPLAEPLTVLPERFPGVRFNVAVCVPFLDAGMQTSHPVFTAGKWATQAVAGESVPHLRLVDLMTSGDAFAKADLKAVSKSIVQLTRSLIEIDGFLSIEHSRQPWKPFREVFLSAREELGTDKDRLKLCYDPCNLLFPGDGVDPNEVTASLEAGELSMVHFKQWDDGNILERVQDGKIDWSEQVWILNQKQYAGAGLMEIAPGENIWENLEGSWEYLRESGMTGIES